MRNKKIMLYCNEEIKNNLEKAKKQSKTSESINSIILACIVYGLKELYGIENKEEN